MSLPPEILSQIPQEYHSGLEKFSDLPSVIKSHSELEKYQGRSIAIPGQGEDGAKWKIDNLPKLQPVLGDMLPPAKPEDYEFKFDGATQEQIKSDEVLGLFRAKAHSLGLSKTQASGLAETFAKEILPKLVSAAPQLPPQDFVNKPEDVNAIMAEVFKGETTQKIDEYKKGVMVLKQSLPEIEDVLNEGVAPYGQKFVALGDHPFMVKLITEIGKLTGADFAGTNGAMSEAGKTAQQEIESIMYDKNNPKHERWEKGDPQVREYIQTLWQATTGGR
jgi:hypothetical protein